LINIHKQLWVVKGFERKVENSSALLAYMTHAEYTKDDVETKAFKSRKGTGVNWAESWQRDKSGTGGELTFDNTPAEGFRIVGSTTRWSTSNKLIQVEDPRGFVVEIPTGNLTTLLKYVIIKEATVVGKCVWGREDSNHVLLPINSEIYQKACDQSSLNAARVSFAKLTVGQVVRFSVDDKVEYTYLGRAKAKWHVKTKKARQPSRNRYSYYNRWEKSLNDEILKEEDLVDTKYCFIFKKKTTKPTKYDWEYKLSGKCIVVGEVKTVPVIEPFDIYIPSRVKEDCSEWRIGYDTGWYYDITLTGFEIKG